MLLRVQCLLVYHTLLGSRVHQLGWLHSDLEFAPVRMRQNIAASGNTITVTALWRVLGIDRLEESAIFWRYTRAGYGSACGAPCFSAISCVSIAVFYFSPHMGGLAGGGQRSWPPPREMLWGGGPDPPLEFFSGGGANLVYFE